METNSSLKTDAPAAAGDDTAAEIVRCLMKRNYEAALALAPLLRPEVFSDTDDAQAACWALLAYELPFRYAAVATEQGPLPGELDRALGYCLTEGVRRLGKDRLGRELAALAAGRHDWALDPANAGGDDFPVELDRAAAFVWASLCVVRQVDAALEISTYSRQFFDDAIELHQAYCIRLIGQLAAAGDSTWESARERAARVLLLSLYYFTSCGLNGSCEIYSAFREAWPRFNARNAPETWWMQTMTMCKRVLDKCECRCC